MIRATIAALSVGFAAVALSAQTPAPTPTPRAVDSVKRARPKPPRAPEPARIWELLPTPAPDIESRLDFNIDQLVDDALSKVNLDAMEGAIDRALWSLDVNGITMPPLPPLSPLEHFDAMDLIGPVGAIAPMEPVEPVDLVASIASIAPMAVEWTPRPSPRQFGGIASEPPQPWAEADPADSLYRLARETLNRGEYRRAAQLFGDITQRFPNSAYAADARYWRAFALYRIGGTSDLRDALKALESDGRRYHQASLEGDARTLATRIRGALAMQGDPQASRSVERTASQQGEPCDKEDVAVRVAALNSLGQTDPESTTPILRRILAKRDECSASLRRSALFLLAKRSDPEAANLILATARGDASASVRADAFQWVARMPGDNAVATLEEIARTPGNESLQRAAVSALARSESPRARQSIRNIIERNELPESIRASALASLDADRAADGGAFIRNVYPRLESNRLKGSAIRALARIGGNDNEQWLLAVVRNPNEHVDLRRLALGHVGRSSISIGDLIRMYDVAGDRPLREQLIYLYARRSEPEATDKLLSIAKTGTDPEMRRLAISRLASKNDPRTKKLLLEIIDQ